ncbi:aldehyde dehydrogenase [Leekyejoonella antrihumi]|uniref:Aldehyde dehydrogenase n=1 Tax=Leekyejoonella antrihumi TaxID=1660198 RepID=A0A563DXE7_9MICO|nr:aldehyde dehydrogenase [Leekyejoonella antrihumi]TWP34930.1 aldehyde dehydrogenase [Leekyejoonella antrihumi]
MTITDTPVDWHTRAKQLVFRTHAFIDGQATPSADGQTRATVNPATGQELAQIADCDERDVDRAVAAARRAFEDGRWSRRSPAERKVVLQRWAALILEHADELALLDSLDAGKLITDTTTGDVPGSAAIVRWYAEAIDKVYGEIAPTGPDALALVTRVPLGVVGAVVPWNFPLEMAIWKLAPALATGNSVVLKPAEESPLSALRVAELAVEAGLPDGVLNVVPGDGPVAGRALGLHQDVDVLTFTGSTAVGKLFLGYAAESNMKQVWLECGGKSANLVFADTADLDAAAEGVCAGIFSNQGQVCSANSRLVVQRSIKDELLDKVVERARGIVLGDPLDPASTMGPLVSDQQASRVLELLADGARTSRTLIGGGRAPGTPSPCFLQPTIFDDVPRDARIAQEEIFGPVLAVFGFDDEREALAIADDTAYGLAASVWSDSVARTHRVADRLHAGTVSINTVDMLDVLTPFGGFGQSGFGRDLSLHALDKFTGLKTTWYHHG